MGVDKFSTIIIASGEKFADALSGSYLAKIKNAPILMTNGKDSNISDIKNYILANLTADGTVYILGGTAAVSAEIEAELAQIGEVVRVKGASRYETSVVIAERYFSEFNGAVLAYGEAFPDGLCGGPLAYAMGAPIILTKTAAPTEAETYMRENNISYII